MTPVSLIIGLLGAGTGFLTQCQKAVDLVRPSIIGQVSCKDVGTRISFERQVGSSGAVLVSSVTVVDEENNNIDVVWDQQFPRRISSGQPATYIDGSFLAGVVQTYAYTVVISDMKGDRTESCSCTASNTCSLAF